MKRKLPFIDGRDRIIKVDLGCGEHRGGCIGIDIFDFGQEIIWDLTQGIPLPDQSVDEMRSSHFLEHLNGEQLDDLFVEIYRVLKPGGTFESRLPHRKCHDAWWWMHKSYWDETTIEGYLNNWWAKLERDRKGTSVNFSIVYNKYVDGNPGELQFKIRREQ